MEYGARFLHWAPFADGDAEPDGAFPSYGEAIRLEDLALVSDSPAFNEAKAYGDDALSRYKREFREADLNVEVLDIERAKMAAITGAQIMEGVGLAFGSDDDAPYGGLAFYTSNLGKDGKTYFEGIFYVKAKANMQGKTYTTKGESITLTNEKLSFKAAACKGNHKWKVISDERFTTEAEAQAWVMARLNKAAAVGV